MTGDSEAVTLLGMQLLAGATTSEALVEALSAINESSEAVKSALSKGRLRSLGVAKRRALAADGVWTEAVATEFQLVLGQLEEEPVVLTQFRPTWGVQAYLRFLGVRHHIVNSAYPSVASTGEFPQLQLADQLVPSQHIFSFLGAHHDTWEPWPPPAAHDELGCAALLAEAAACLRQLRFADDETCEAINSEERSNLLFPMSWLLLPYSRVKFALSHRFSRSAPRSVEEARRILVQTHQCLNQRLAAAGSGIGWPDAESRPRRLDARIFGHVAAVVQLANTCDSARSLLHGCDHLCALYDRIRTSFFGHENTEWQHEGTCSRPNAFGQEPPEPGDWFFDKSFQPPAKAPMGVSSAKPTDPSATPRRAATTRSVIRPDLLRHRLSSAEHARRRRNLTAIAVAVGSLSVYLMISLVTADHEDLALPDDD